jgi:hypothetical protein
MESERSLTGKDVVSKLFQNEPAPKDDLGELYDLHRQAFQTSSYKELQIPPSDSSSSKSNTVIEDADMLLNVFRNRQHYFPFVSISENASASSMAVDHPFLLMAILNVCSSRVPSLHQKTDERFRQVLSQRIVFHDEKSLDYLQGLLVYIAWYFNLCQPQREKYKDQHLTFHEQVPLSLQTLEQSSLTILANCTEHVY